MLVATFRRRKRTDKLLDSRDEGWNINAWSQLFANGLRKGSTPASRREPEPRGCGAPCHGKRESRPPMPCAAGVFTRLRASSATGWQWEACRKLGQGTRGSSRSTDGSAFALSSSTCTLPSTFASSREMMNDQSLKTRRVASSCIRLRPHLGSDLLMDKYL